MSSRYYDVDGNPLVALATYTLQLIGPAIPSIVASPQNFAHMLRETEENLTDLLPEGFSVRIKEWDDE
jgi:hypothetical protein